MRECGGWMGAGRDFDGGFVSEREVGCCVVDF